MIDWMLETAAAVTVLIALVLLVRGPAMRTFGPGIAYALWLLPLGRAVLPEVTMTLEIPAATTVTMEPMAVVAASEATLAPAQTLQVMDWSMALAAVWLTGVVLLSANAALAYARLRRGVAADISLIDVVGRVPIVQSSGGRWAGGVGHRAATCRLAARLFGPVYPSRAGAGHRP